MIHKFTDSEIKAMTPAELAQELERAEAGIRKWNKRAQDLPKWMLKTLEIRQEGKQLYMNKRHLEKELSVRAQMELDPSTREHYQKYVEEFERGGLDPRD